MTKIGMNVETCLGNNQDNFQLHRFIESKTIATGFLGVLFDSHCSCSRIIPRLVLRAT